MLQAYTLNATGLAVAQDEALRFDNNNVMTGCTATHAPGTTTVALNKPGFYMVHFNAYGATEATAGDLTVTMYANGEEVPFAAATETSSAATDLANLAFSTIVQVRPSCCYADNTVRLTFINEGVAALYNLFNVVVTKLC